MGQETYKLILLYHHLVIVKIMSKEQMITVWILVIFQLSLVEREINEVMKGGYSRSNRSKRKDSGKDMANSDDREKLKQKQIEEEDVCPICQDELLRKPEPLTYCK